MARLTAGKEGPALTDETGTTTWPELDERVNRLTNGLVDAGIDTIAIVAGNRREWFELAMACAHAGAVYIPVNWHWSPEEIEYVLEDSGAKAVLVGDRFKDLVPDDRLVLVAGEDSYEDFLAAASPAEPEKQVLGGPMFYTSGTTGHPKGVRGGLVGDGETPTEIMELVAAGFADFVPRDGRTLLVGPVYHSAQWAFSLLPMIIGSSVVMRHKFDPAEALALIDEHAITNIHLVPTQFKRLLDVDRESRERFDGSSLEVVWHGAAPCPPEIKRRMIEWWGPVISEYYGSTEGSIISRISSEEWLERGGSVGRPVDTIEVMVVGDGPEGQLYFRNKLGMDFEYHNDPQKTEAAHLEPGVFTTGDVGYIDDDGYLWLSDRAIDMIISGGVNIYPAEIEGVLGGHPAVADVAVFGVPDDEFGEAVKASVQPAPGYEPSDELSTELIDHCREHIAHYKAPRSIDWVEQIPRTETGKLQKRLLREPYWAGTGRRI